MKFVMVLPPSPWLISDRDQPFLGALYFVSAIKNYGLEVDVVDLAGMPEEHWHFPIGDVYGVTGATPNFPYMKKIIEILKTREPNKPVIVGGVHATVLPRHILEHTRADICVVGEAEYSITGIINKIATGQKMERVALSIAPEDLNQLYYPDRDCIDYYDYMVPKTYKYLVSQNNVREASIITGRGCPFNCSYCGSHFIYKGKVRLRKAYSVFSELKMLKDKYDIGLCNFVDDTFPLNNERVYDICELIAPLGIKWFFLTRVDVVDLDLFKYMKECGCVSVTFGFESGSNKMLDILNKKTTLEQAYKAIKISKAAGLKVRGQLMVGLPYESDEDVEATATFIKKSTEVDTFGLHILQPFPGCDIWLNPDRYGFEIKDKIEFDKYHTIGKPEDILTEDSIKWERFKYLKSVIGNRSIDVV